MSNQRNYKPQTRDNRFGEKEAIIWCPEKYSKKEERVIDGVFTKLIEIGGKVFKLEMSPANKTKEIRGETRNGMWLKLTEKKKNSGSSNRGF